MPKLHIALHDGFAGQRVQIKVNGRAVFDRAGVRTDLRISRADAIDVEAPLQPSRISITIDPGGISGATEVAPGPTPYLAADLEENGHIRWTPSAEPFRYL